MTIVKDNLIAARALIDTPEKWGQEDYEPRPGCFCSVGAIAKAKGSGPTSKDETGPEARALEVFIPSEFIGIVRFNDDPETTHADIMALFDRAILAQDAS